MATIISKRQLAEDIFRFEIEAPHIARKAKAGQFVVVRVHERGERVPLTIADSDPGRGVISAIVQRVGGTTARLSAMDQGDDILDVAGPLGSPTHIKNFGTAVCIGGGVGTAEAYPIARALKEAGNTVIAIIGARTRNLVIMEQEMRRVADRVEVSTDDGSYGHHGFVTDVLTEIIEEGVKVDFALAIGPVPMMRAVADLTRPLGIKTVASLNPIMVDGTGMCGGCRVTVGGKTRFACVDGPEFDAHEIDFDELVKRQRMYKDMEKRALQRADHSCKLDKAIEESGS